MKNNIYITLLAALFLLSGLNATIARDSKKSRRSKTKNIKATTAGCKSASAFEWLDINNVKARINTGGDMWLVPGGNSALGAQYFIPKNGTATSMYAGSLWIGGLDINNQIKLAAHRFRSEGTDFYTGPLTVDNTASIEEETCLEYDRFFKMTRPMVEEFLGNFKDGVYTPVDGYSIPQEIEEWPAHGDIDKKQAKFLAPFKDVNDDNEYNPKDGDYPYYDFNAELCKRDIPTMESDPDNYDEGEIGLIEGGKLSDQVIKGDQTLWWVFNDKGNAHTETNSQPIGLEIRAQAFAFNTSDEINNMTFYSYEIINRSTYELTNTFFSPWVDTDLGHSHDDYVGCDVMRGLGYCYNGDQEDGSGEPAAYGFLPPAIGVDFFQGPYLDPDGADNPKYEDDGTLICSEAINGVNFGDDIIDNERYGMRRFVYHNITGTGNESMQDPVIAADYYNYLRGIWKDNSRMSYGGNGHRSDEKSTGPDCDFMFPGDTDPCDWGTKGSPPSGEYGNGLLWTEKTIGNEPGDRRFMQSAGPFTLKPGAVNYITVGIPWARATSGDNWSSVELLRKVDDKCQALFEDCFRVPEGPDAPSLSFSEYDNKLICYISNEKNSNNYKESYDYRPKTLILPEDINTIDFYKDTTYTFEGYIIYQLLNDKVGPDELDNPDKARIVAQFDKKNRFTTLTNMESDDVSGMEVPVTKVKGENRGIQHSFVIDEDLFGTTNDVLVNHKTYYYMAIAYAVNQYLPYKNTDPNSAYVNGQKLPYIDSRKNIKLYTAIPHKTVNGAKLNSEYGSGFEVKRLQGRGNGGLELELTDESVEKLLAKAPAGSIDEYGNESYPVLYNPVYKQGKGPLNIKVIDPLKLKNGKYILRMNNPRKAVKRDVSELQGATNDTILFDTYDWTLEINGKKYSSDVPISESNEQIFASAGISVSLSQTFNPGVHKAGYFIQTTASGPVRNTIYEELSDNNGLIESYVKYADSTKKWLSGVNDVDFVGNDLNWIRAGNYHSPAINLADTKIGRTFFADKSGVFGKIADGIVAPVGVLASNSQNKPLGLIKNYVSKSSIEILNKIPSVDIVLTNDKSKWTRSVVLEMCQDPLLSQDGGDKYYPRKSPSVDKDGNFADIDAPANNDPNSPNYISSTGMGWFPGYAIDLETGARLNIIFGEDSFLSDQNGDDMIFNPTERDLRKPSPLDPNIIEQGSGAVLAGGKHAFYVMGIDTSYNDGERFEFGAYDACKNMMSKLRWLESIPSPNTRKKFEYNVWKPAVYAGYLMGVRNQEWLNNDVKIAIRVTKPYEKYMMAGYPNTLSGLPEKHKINDNNPAYEIITKNVAPEFNSSAKHQSDLDLINVVPNPYYAYSSYERNALDNRVKITNLPDECEVTIYNVNGTKIRQYRKDTDNVSSIDWDLKNFAGVPIAGGIYLIHVKSNQGERVIKWFGTLRQIDLNKF
ncbi:MAG: T9SS type A sorting domain-containing protein [Hyphomicrobiales bacterium]